ncbi:MAG: MBL fold metallo-hydrolase [Ignavibacteriaceae bacterium]|jgi:glyoxylase-like metal-dependent hydrolase (beta-lactamase superfamily II)|nr:MBL fold metallo-hydrolase [Ignavibacteriaceae bacterium]
MIEVKTFTFNPFSENSYLVWEKESRQAAVIDPGCFSSKEENELKNFILRKQLSVKYLFNSHCHLDHIFGNNFVLKEFQPQYFIPELDKTLLENAPTQARLFGMEMANVQPANSFFSEETSLFLGVDEIRFLFTPGHSPGEFCIYFPGNFVCFTGDVLFQNSIGRTDLMGGNYKTLIDSIKEKLFTLPEETIIYPGHGDSSTIGEEKEHNPFFSVN